MSSKPGIESSANTASTSARICSTGSSETTPGSTAGAGVQRILSPIAATRTAATASSERNHSRWRSGRVVDADGNCIMISCRCRSQSGASPSSRWRRASMRSRMADTCWRQLRQEPRCSAAAGSSSSPATASVSSRSSRWVFIGILPTPLAAYAPRGAAAS